MDTNDRVFERSLRCLQHPLSVLSIALLLVNDHVLKSLNPSCITGKLSDFAGLFFFPFIVSAGVGLLPLKLKDGRRSIGLFSIGITGVWFLLLKTLPLANVLSNQLASSILGRPVSFSLDWTDCFALVVLVPAWLLWNGYAVRLDRRMALASLTVGTLAGLATSPAPMPDVIFALAQRGSIVYAFPLRSNYHPFFSTDQGVTWARCDSDHSCPSGPNQALPRPLPIQVCDPHESTTCYRITGAPEVEISVDAGITWSVAWQIPPGRRVFLQRNGGISIPSDLMISAAPRRILLVAMGEEGVLRHELPGGSWEQVAVGYSLRRPQLAATPAEALRTIVPELALGLGGGLLSVLLGGLFIWSAMRAPKRSNRAIAAWLGITVAFTLSSVILVLLGFEIISVLLLLLPRSAWISGLYALETPIRAFSLYAAPFLVFTLRLRSLQRELDATGGPRRRLSTRALATAVAVTFLVPAPYLLWALAVIPAYITAQIVSICMAALIIYAGYGPLLRSLPRTS